MYLQMLIRGFVDHIDIAHPVLPAAATQIVTLAHSSGANIPTSETYCPGCFPIILLLVHSIFHDIGGVAISRDRRYIQRHPARPLEGNWLLAPQEVLEEQLRVSTKREITEDHLEVGDVKKFSIFRVDGDCFFGTWCHPYAAYLS